MERVYQVLADQLCTSELGKEELPEINLYETFLTAILDAIRAPTTLPFQATPVQLVFRQSIVTRIFLN